MLYFSLLCNPHTLRGHIEITAFGYLKQGGIDKH